VFDYLHPATARGVLVQALLAAPMFGTRWRWNAQRSLLLERARNGRRVPAALLRMRADDLLAAAFPQALACPETLPPGPIEPPDDHPIVRQTVEDCLTEAMDAEGLLEVLRALRDGSIERRAVDTPEPSAFARGILSSQPYTFLDDAPLEERRTRAVAARRVLHPRAADAMGALDPAAIARVRDEAWPQPADADEVDEALLWMGYATVDEARGWQGFVDALAAAGRVVRVDDRWFALEATREPKEVLRGRLSALGPVFVDPGSPDEALLLQLEAEGAVLRARIDGRTTWCDRRLLARIHRYTLDRLRREIEPVTAAQFLRFLACWQHVLPEHRVDGPAGVVEVVEQLAGFEVPAAAWEASVLPSRVRGYRREWLDQLTLAGEVTWARLWGAGLSPVRRAPIALLPREQIDSWTALAAGTPRPEPQATGREVLELLSARGATFVQEIARGTRLPMASVEDGLAGLVATGRVTCDSFGGLRRLIVPAWRRTGAGGVSGRWSRLEPGMPLPADEAAAFAARQLLRRTGVVFRRTLERERLPLPWRDVARACRALEARGEIRGGRFVAGFDGEQYALAEAVTQLRRVRRDGPRALGAGPLEVSACDPLNFEGILTPEPRVAATAGLRVAVG
jgi:ATP-dependent Lhr-like helicase